MGFQPPDASRRAQAIGSLAGLPPALRRAFDPDAFFDPVPPPGPHDWLNVAPERGQTFDAFVAATTRPGGGRRHFYLQPIGDFPRTHRPLLEQLRKFGAAFLAREVRLLAPLGVARARITTRRNRYTGVLQLKTRDILPLLARGLPADADCVLGVTAEDLYPEDGWMFVFGEAMVDDRVAVFSIARHDPRFYDKPADPALLLRRACKVLAHETCHMLGIRHCIFFNCLMNGSNDLAEGDRRPPHLCPVDLRKIHRVLGFDIADHYRRLLTFWRAAGIADEADWTERRLAFLEDR